MNEKTPATQENSADVSVENLGPIDQLSFSLQDHGVTVLTGPNGSGKTTLLNALQSASLGSGKLPLKDGEKKGVVSAFGANISIGKSTKHRGEFEVHHLSSPIDLATLVDPKIKSNEAADKARVKALFSLTQSQCGIDKFNGMQDFDKVVHASVAKIEDPLEMAAAIKKNYQEVAKEIEDEAKVQKGRVLSIESNIEESDVDGVETDAKILQQNFEAALHKLSRLEGEKKFGEESVKRYKESQEKLDRLLEERPKCDVWILERSIGELDSEISVREKEIEAMNKALQKVVERKENLSIRMKSGIEHNKLIESLEDIVKGPMPDFPSDEEIETASKEKEQAALAIDDGARARQLIAERDSLKELKEYQLQLEIDAQDYREVAKQADKIISKNISCEELFVETDDDGKTYLKVSDNKDRPGVRYGELSEGERWRTAIRLGAKTVGEDGLLVIPQEAWESLDVYVRDEINNYAKELKVFILTAEASRDAETGRELKTETL